MDQLRFAVQVFLLTKRYQIPTELLVQSDVFHVILYNLLMLATKSSKTQGVAVYIGWEPPQEEPTTNGLTR